MNNRILLSIAVSALVITHSNSNSHQFDSRYSTNNTQNLQLGNQPQMGLAGGNTGHPSHLQPNPMISTSIPTGINQNMPVMGNSIADSNLGPQMGFGTKPSGGSFIDPQLSLDNPFIGMSPQESMLNPALQMDAPGITNPFSIKSLVNNANSKVSPQELQALQVAVQAYTDGNLGDARRHFSSVTERFPEGVATDRAYLGLAKIERAYGAYDVSRRILEAVIRKNRDYESIMLARRSYKDLQAEVQRSVAAANRDMEASYAVYKQIGWLNIFSKVRAYNAYKNAKANFEGILISSKQFDPIFSQVNMTTPLPEGNLPNDEQRNPVDPDVPGDVQTEIDNQLTIQTTPYTPPKKQANFLNPQVNGNTIQITADQLLRDNTPENSVEQKSNMDTQVTSPQNFSDTTQPKAAKPISEMSLDEARVAYLDIYEKLKQALKGDDTKLKQKLQVDYRSALHRYNELRTK
tara:strand:+ start:1434 stop:2822 length:1389 start_codon:yes stop_codon:yes gene_type:complete